MRRLALRALRVLAQVVVAGGFTRVIDAWVVDLNSAWQLTVLALTQLTVAFAQAYLEEHGAIPAIFRPTLGSQDRPHPRNVQGRWPHSPLGEPKTK